MVKSHPMSIKLVTAEYQFDRNKVTIYFDTRLNRVDFREFVRDLFAIFKLRIWMQKVDSERSFALKPYATKALRSGVEVHF
jgi:cell fate regulator YaaT (PSP1 superfamily)